MSVFVPGRVPRKIHEWKDPRVTGAPTPPDSQPAYLSAKACLAFSMCMAHHAMKVVSGRWFDTSSAPAPAASATRALSANMQLPR